MKQQYEYKLNNIFYYYYSYKRTIVVVVVDVYFVGNGRKVGW